MPIYQDVSFWLELLNGLMSLRQWLTGWLSGCYDNCTSRSRGHSLTMTGVKTEDGVAADVRDWIRGGLDPYLTQRLQRLIIIIVSGTSQSVCHSSSNAVHYVTDTICRNLHSGANFRTEILHKIQKFFTVSRNSAPLMPLLCWCCHPPEPVGSAVVQPRLTWGPLW